MGPGRDFRGSVKDQQTAMVYLMALIDQAVALNSPRVIGPIYSVVGLTGAHDEKTKALHFKLVVKNLGVKKKTPNVRERDKFEVFRRDHYQCRYTGIKLITHPMLELLSYLLPSHFPYDNPHSGSDKGSKNTHLLVWVLWPSVDHIIPVSQGGLNEMSNYTTANSKFNMFKGNILNEHLGLEFLDAADKNWKGLEDEYQSLLIKYRDQVPLSRLPKLENWAMLMR
jgi:5-methylcytosine-specific restriction endonuclease McrA